MTQFHHQMQYHGLQLVCVASVAIQLIMFQIISKDQSTHQLKQHIFNNKLFSQPCKLASPLRQNLVSLNNPYQPETFSQNAISSHNQVILVIVFPLLYQNLKHSPNHHQIINQLYHEMPRPSHYQTLLKYDHLTNPRILIHLKLAREPLLQPQDLQVI